MFESQKDTPSLYAQLFSLQTQKQHLKCPNKNQAYLVCMNPQCKTHGFICTQSSCQCLKNHLKCNFIQLDKFLDIVDRNQKFLPYEIKKSYQAVHQIIDEMIEQLSQMKRKFYLEERYFRLNKALIPFMELIDQQKIQKFCQQISGKVAFQLKDALKSNINYTIRNSKDIINDFKVKKSQFNYLLKYIEDSYTKYDFKVFLGDSRISDFYHKEIMHIWLSETLDVKNVSSKLLFRASEHNFSAHSFHKHCDGLKNTLVIIKTEFNKVIGGFTPNSWQSKGGYVHDYTGKAFLFSLTLNEKYGCTDPRMSIFCSRDGPIFGHDINLSDNADKTNSYASFPFSYNLPVNGGSQYHSQQQTYTLFSGAKKGNAFKVKQYEVYEIFQKNIKSEVTTEYRWSPKGMIIQDEL